MFTVTFGQIKSRNFAESLHKLVNIKGLSMRANYAVAKIYNALEHEQGIVSGLYEKLLDEFVVKIDGIMVQEPPGSGNFKLEPKTSAEFHARAKDFDLQEIHIDLPRLSLLNFIKELTPKDIAALFPLWDELDEEKLK